MRFSATDAVFEGFRIARANPVAIAIWAVIFLVVNTVATAAMVGLSGPALIQFESVQGDPAALPPAELASLLGSVFAGYFVLMVVSLFAYALVLPAISRAVLQPQAKGSGFLAFGGVELRHLVLLFIMMLAISITYFIGVMVISMIVALSGIVGIILAIPLFVGLLLLVAVVAAHFSLAGPAALMEGGLGIRRSFALVRGRVWAVTGGVILSYVMMAVVLLLVFMVMAGVAAAFGGTAGLGALWRPDTSSVAAYFSPTVIINLIPGALGASLMTGIVGGFGADAYRQLSQAEVESTRTLGGVPLI